MPKVIFTKQEIIDAKDFLGESDVSRGDVDDLIREFRTDINEIFQEYVENRI